MKAERTTRRSFLGRFRRLTLIECLVIIAIAAVVVALVVPPVKWASSGTLEIPVRVKVFDVNNGQLIAGAHVAIVRAPPLVPGITLEEVRERFPNDLAKHLQRDNSHLMGTDGSVVVMYEFRTGGNYKRPTPHAHLRFVWVLVAAEGYGGVVVPVRYESQPTKKLKEQKELPVTIGLLPNR